MLSLLSLPLRRFAIVRASAVAILFYGFAGAATAPYQSLVGIRILGLSDAAYSLITFLGAVANVVATLVIGMMADRSQSFRPPMLMVATLGIIGYGAVWAWPSGWMFALASIGPIAFFHVVNTLIFANIRNHSEGMSPALLADSITITRMAISLAWVLVPGLVAAVLAGRGSILGAYAIAAALAAGCLATLLWLMPPDQRKPAPGAVGLGREGVMALRRLLAPGVIARVTGTALVTSVLHVNAIILPLIITESGLGTVRDVGVIMGMVAGLELVFMLVWAHLGRWIAPVVGLAIATGLYALYLVWLGRAGAMWEVYAASVIGGIGAAAIVSQPIGYLLDILRDRPGLSASLIAVNLFTAGALGAGIFALGSAIGSYTAVACVSAAAGLLGVGILLALEGWGRDHG